MTAIKTQLHFQRFEFKYILTLEQFEGICRFLRNYMDLDGFAKKTKNGFYEVFSLYYDSPRFYYYWEKIDGRKRRKKIRLRTYRDNGCFSKHVFFEIKRKYDAIILKDRFPVSVDDEERLAMDGSFLNTEAAKAVETKEIVKEFRWEKGLRHLAPKVLVVYNRKPYVGKFNKNARVTFDYAIRARSGNCLLYKGDRYADVSGGRVVMEVKFRGSVPFYIAHIIKIYNLQRVPYSKYCHGLESCYSLPLLSSLGSHSQSDLLRLDKNQLLI